MTTPLSPNPATGRIVIDYTSRDYKAIRSRLVGLARGLMPDWQTVGETGDFGTLLLELYAYAGDIMNYYIDRVGSEAFLGTAVRRQSVMYIADMFGYKPRGQRAATAPVTFSWSFNSDNDVTNDENTIDTAKVEDGLVTLTLKPGVRVVDISPGQTITVSNMQGAAQNAIFEGTFIVRSIVPASLTTNFKLTYKVSDTTTKFSATVPSTAKVSSGRLVIIPAKTVVSTQPDSKGTVIPFETNFEVKLDSQAAVADPNNPSSNYKTVTVKTSASEGRTVAPTLIGTSKGIPNAEFVITDAGVIDRTVTVYTKEGGQVVTWSRVDKMSLGTPTQSVYTTYVDDQNYTHILFGDNSSGRIPPANVEIYAGYRYGFGALANSLGVDSINVLSNAFANSVGVQVTNPSSPVGGADVESVDSMRYSIPRSAALKQRAVTLDDYVNLALQVPGITKAVAYGSNYSTVYVKIASNEQSIGYISSDVAGYLVKNGIITLSLSENLTISNDQLVYLNGVDSAINGTNQAVDSGNNTTSYRYITAPITVTKAKFTVASPNTDPGVAEITTSVAHSYATGDVVYISGVDAAMSTTNLFDGLHVITSYTDTTFQFAKVYGSSVTTPASISVSTALVNRTASIILSTSAADTPSNGVMQSTYSTKTITNKALTSNLATLTSNSHGFLVGQTVHVSGVGAPFDGTFIISAVTTNTFKYYVESSNISSTSASGTATRYLGTATTVDPEMQLLINSLESYLSDKKLIGSVVYGEPVDWNDIDVRISVNVLPLYNRESVRASVQKAIETVFSYDKVGFGKRISVGDIYRAALSVDGVDYAVLTGLQTSTGSPPSVAEDVNSVDDDPNNAYRIPRINPDILAIYPSGWVTATGGLVNT